jgi:hypothetical protein
MKLQRVPVRCDQQRHIRGLPSLTGEGWGEGRRPTRTGLPDPHTGSAINFPAKCSSCCQNGALRDKLADASQRLADLLARYNSRHPAVVTVEAEIRDIERSIAAETQRNLLHPCDFAPTGAPSGIAR